ncbi:MAG: DNA replication/repair protein RecF [Caldilineae bacterium]|nr:MAG: DNA replication/repair protein RecF [Caldilineae bacterium]
MYNPGMLLRHLSLTNFRNYVRLELDLAPGLSIVQGENAQGKSNLLEAIAYLATSRSPRAGSDAELVNWLVREEPYPYARLAAEVEKHQRVERLDITLLPARNNHRYRKQVRINGVNRRAIDLVGLMPVVLFRPEDVELVAGTPQQRRRYLDIALCQMEPPYCRALSEYNKTLSQRNALLRHLAEGGGDPVQELRFWNDKLAETGSLVMAKRQWFINRLEREASLRHLDLSGGFERLRLRYLPSFDPGIRPEPRQRRYPSTASLRERGVAYEALTPEQVRASFLAHLQAGLSRDLAAGMTLLGPHRDDLGFYLGEYNLRTYGSRGQQRTAALAARLAEVTIMTEAGGTAPILLMDDVMSELDATRRAMLVEALTSVPQAIVTTTDWEDFQTPLLEHATRLTVHAGQLTRLSAPVETA